ncbi:Metallo-dependent hydrolase [Pseudovirgaria hyperparasitica]|uniref:N-acetylglucosamine-6-phosphate deacetylase n=1 Tax=Pseudovirgaria hyperparasitica TaxID=470096 RepID=A0A6A6WDC8_9PEZI|nr:Metallo-dependent hydrolase [Pseudovirgaria hyperparasitica]KAF2760575.1 Metallo-dependent hydrolase [Pseudovirgaria hyperparasitica]
MSDASFTTFTNCRYCLNGKLVDDRLVVSGDSGTILNTTGYIGGDIIDLDDAIIAPGFLELHTNGVHGFHFTHYEDSNQYQSRLNDTARYYATQGVTGFWATIPTVSSENFKKILPSLSPQDFPGGASLLGAHAEGPFLWPSKKGAHNASLFASPPTTPVDIYGNVSLQKSLKLVTVAPEIPGSATTISTLTTHGIKVSLGHSDAAIEQGAVGLSAGAIMLTHVLNATSPLTSRAPGLAGLITLPENNTPKPPYYSIIADGHHLHPSTLAFLHRAAPQRSILITDSIELSGLADGVHPGHAQIPFPQRKQGTRATIDGTETLIGGCISLQECVRNLIKWTGCGIAEAVQSATENIASMMGIDGEGGRGFLVPGQRADLCVLNDEGEVLQTWISGKKVWDKDGI